MNKVPKVPRVLFYCLHQDGVGYYRMAEPARMLQKLGLADVTMNPFSPTGKLKNYWGDFSDFADFMDGKKKKLNIAEDLLKVLGKPDKPNFDAIVFQRYDHIGPFSVMLGLKEEYKIPIIQENDDYLWDIPEQNPGIINYHEVKPENQVTPNEAMYLSRKSLGLYDAYIVSTPFLKKLYENYSPTYVCPNSLDLSLRKFDIPKPHGKDEIRIGFSASAGHITNLQMILPVMREIMEKYPSVYFYSYKHMPKPFVGTPLEKRVRLMKWVPVTEYPTYLHSLSLDMGIAPLTDRLFNRAKSNLRLLEYWSSGHYPVVASRVGHYAETVRDGINGFLATEHNEWVEKISKLIEQPILRRKLGDGGHRTLVKDFNLEKNARLWADAIKCAIRSYSPDRQPPSQYLPPELR